MHLMPKEVPDAAIGLADSEHLASRVAAVRVPVTLAVPHGLLRRIASSRCATPRSRQMKVSPVESAGTGRPSNTTIQPSAHSLVKPFSTPVFRESTVTDVGRPRWRYA